MNSIKKALKSLAPGLLACATLVTLAAAPTLAAPTPTTPVSGCGALTGNNKIFELTANITTSSKGDCIVLWAWNSALDMHGFSITGPGTQTSQGAGIRVRGHDDLIEAGNGFVQDFKIGVADEGSNTVGDDINLDDNVTGLKLSGQTDRWTNMEEAGNTANGIWLWYCYDECGVTEFISHDNGANGVLVEKSDGAKIDVFVTTTNGGDGIHVGSTYRYLGNKKVRVFDGNAGSTMEGYGPNTEFGVVLDTSEANATDQVTLTQALGNAVDLEDETANCGSNVFNIWFDNNYDTSQAGGTSSPACILPSLPF